MSLFGWGDAVAQGIDSAAQIAMNNANIANQQQINAQNNAFTQMMNEQNHQWQNEYNQTIWNREDAYNQTTWEREDSAYQRQVEDMIKAGLNPALASGGAASGGGTTGNGGGASQGEALHNDPLPQMSINLDLFGKLQDVKEKELRNKELEHKIEMDSSNFELATENTKENERHNKESEKIQREGQSWKTHMTNIAMDTLKEAGILKNDGKINFEGMRNGENESLNIIEQWIDDRTKKAKEKENEKKRKEALNKQGSGKHNINNINKNPFTYTNGKF